MWHQQLRDMLDIKLTGCIFVNTSPDVCLTRLNKRNRKGENGIPLDYLELLHNKHNEWLLSRPKNESFLWYGNARKNSLDQLHSRWYVDQ